MPFSGRTPGPPPRILLEIDQAMRRNDMAKAIGLARLALDQGHVDPVLFNLRAYWHESEGRFATAVDDLERARALAPNDARILNALGRCLTQTGRFDEAVAVLDAALALAPRRAAIHYNKGFALEMAAELTAARITYERALELDPQMSGAVARLAGLAARRSDWTAARALADRALSEAPHDSIAHFAHVMAELHDGQFAAAERRLRAVIAEPRTPEQGRANAFNFLGDALHGQERYADAFAAYLESKTILKALYGGRFESPADTGMTITTRVLRAMEAAPVWTGWTPPASPGQAPAGLVFLIGFPRTGTTLLGQLLAAHPDVAVAEEKPLLGAAITEFVLAPDGLARLASLSETERNRHRSLYFANAARALPEAAGRILVDQNPLNTVYLPLIAALFPDARIVFALRDPRDVVLSCFRRLFVVNPYTYEFLSLERAARFYDATMRLAEAARQRLPLAWLDVRNEALVAEFEDTAEMLCRFLGIEWNNSLKNFSALSKSRVIATPSATQVARGLNREGFGQWRHYQAEMRGVLPILESWAARFQYAD